MPSRETFVQGLAVLIALLVFVTLAAAINVGTAESVGLGALFYFLALGGSHLYLLARGVDGGAIPDSARKRFLAFLAGALVLWAFSQTVIDPELSVLDFPARTVVLAAVGVLFLAYFGYEARDAYRSMETP